MAVVPNTIEGKIEFFEQRLPLWQANPGLLGLDAGELAAMAALTTQARAQYEAALASRIAAKAATLEQNNAVANMANYGGKLVNTIRNEAEKTNNPNIYAQAGIDAPKPPTPAGAPEQPTNLVASLLPGGGLRIAWDGSVAQSAYFSVYRRVGSAGAFTLLDSVDEKFFDDFGIPAGSSSITYYIDARRDEFRVSSGWFQVNFGAGGAVVTQLTMAA